MDKQPVGTYCNSRYIHRVGSWPDRWSVGLILGGPHWCPNFVLYLCLYGHQPRTPPRDMQSRAKRIKLILIKCILLGICDGQSVDWVIDRRSNSVKYLSFLILNQYELHHRILNWGTVEFNLYQCHYPGWCARHCSVFLWHVWWGSKQIWIRQVSHCCIPCGWLCCPRILLLLSFTHRIIT